MIGLRNDFCLHYNVALDSMETAKHPTSIQILIVSYYFSSEEIDASHFRIWTKTKLAKESSV